MASADEHRQQAERLLEGISSLPVFEDGTSPWAERALDAAKVHATLAMATRTREKPVEASRYGAEFDRLASSWQALEDEHDQIHPDRDECGGVGGCSAMFAAVGLERQMIDQLTEWRRSLAIREGRAACSCDHHGDHAGCDHACECAS